jgi:hypothetical protein
LTFVHAYLGFVVWTARRQAQAGRPARQEIQNLLLVHGVPGVFLLVFYLTSIRGMAVGGGPVVAPWVVLERLVGMGLGGPGEGWQALPWVAVAVVLFALGLRLLAAHAETVWVFFFVAVFAAPFLFTVCQPPLLYERYYLIPFAFLLLPIAYVLGTLWRARLSGYFVGWPFAILSLLLLQVMVIGSVIHVCQYARAGRGQFREALQWVLDNDPAPVVEITGDHDLRVHQYIDFYARYLQDSRTVVYVGRNDLPADGVPWFFAHRLGYPPGEDNPPEVEHDSQGNRYRLVRAYPSRGLGCWGWFVYRRDRSVNR